MSKYVAFLRAINVGSHTVKMDQLRQMFTTMGFSNVETFITSGNVIFDSRSRNTRPLESKIEEHLQRELGYPAATFVRSIPDLADIAGYNPFESELDAGGKSLYIGFLKSRPGAEATRKLESCSSKTDTFHIHDREVYWLIHGGTFSSSQFSGARIEKTLGAPTTIRNVTTVKRIASKLDAAGSF
jgi:uncharacterized protein (DUF1697 family)